MLRTASRVLRQQQRRLYRPLVASNGITPRAVSYSTAHMASSLSPVDPPLSSIHPADAFQLLQESDKPGAEQEIFDQQVQQVKEWWASPRFKGIKRPYTPEAVVSKRGTLQQVYPSSLMARKLFNLLEERHAQGKPVHTSRYSL